MSTTDVIVEKDQIRKTTIWVHIRAHECILRFRKEGFGDEYIMQSAFQVGFRHRNTADQAWLLREVAKKLGTLPTIPRTHPEVTHGSTYSLICPEISELRKNLEIGIYILFLELDTP